jgi:Tfp pilus assembly ATPase PilU
MQTSKKLGMVTLNDALLELVDGKLVEPREAWTKAVDKSALAATLRTRGHDVSLRGRGTLSASGHATRRKRTSGGRLVRRPPVL